MKVTDVILNSEQISGNAEGSGFLLEQILTSEYINGKRAETPSLLRYGVVFPENDFEKVFVKIPGTKTIVSAEQLAQNKGKIRIKFKNLRGKFYRTNSGEYALTCSADGVEVIS